MSDRMLIVLLIVFVMIGVFSYDQYVQSTGKISPVAQFLDYAKLRKFEDWRKSKTTTQKREVYHYQVESNLNRLNVKFTEIKESRENYLLQRREILDKLEKFLIDYREEGKKFAEVIGVERSHILENYPNLNQLKLKIAALANISDPIARGREFLNIKSGFMQQLKAVVSDPQEDIPRISAIFDLIEQIISAEPAQLIKYCKGSVESCLTEDAKLIEDELNYMVKRIVEWPERDFKRIDELMYELIHEYRIMSMNEQATESNLSDTDKKIQSNFKQLVEDLIQIDEEHVLKISKLYGELRAEQEEFLLNLYLNRRRLYEKHRDAINEFRGIVDDLAENPQMDFEKFLAYHKQALNQLQEMLRDFDANEKKINLLYENRRISTEGFILNLADLVGVDKEIIKEKYDIPAGIENNYFRQKMQEQTNNSLKASEEAARTNSSEMHDDSHFADNESGRMLKENELKRREMQQQIKQTNQEMDLQREKAKDHGYYDRSF